MPSGTRVDIGAGSCSRMAATMPGFVLRTLAVGRTEPERFENPGGFVHFEMSADPTRPDETSRPVVRAQPLHPHDAGGAGGVDEFVAPHRDGHV